MVGFGVSNRVGRLRSAFTMIELMVVVVIIALLVSILLPALAKAKALGKQTKEMAACEQKLIALMGYAHDNKGTVFPGYIPWAAGHFGNQPGGYYWFHEDPWAKGFMTEGNVIKVNGVRWMGATYMSPEAVQVDQRTLTDFLSRPNVGVEQPSYTPRTILYDSAPDTLACAMAYHPSLGFNSTYVGGAWNRGGFPNYTAQTGPGHPNPKWYVTKVDEVRRTDFLMIFCSTRGVDNRSTGGWGATNYGRDPAPYTGGPGSIVPGFHEVVPPRSGYPTNSSVIQWVVSNTFKANSNPASWGFADMRHGGKAVTGLMDGHTELQTLKQLRDMRKWANHADRADWAFRTR